MKPHLAYLKYIIRHKWFVFLACRACGVSLWRATIHDWSKFLPCEWLPYAKWFYGRPDYETWEQVPVSVKTYHWKSVQVRSDWKAKFDEAWNHHQKMNLHHWQYWLLTFDEGITVELSMPKHYVREMVADWFGAGRAITGKWEAPKWYEKNQHKIKLHPESRVYAEALLSNCGL